MKSKDEYKEAITEVRQEQEARERENGPANPRRSQGSNDREGMGMDE